MRCLFQFLNIRLFPNFISAIKSARLHSYKPLDRSVPALIPLRTVISDTSRRVRRARVRGRDATSALIDLHSPQDAFARGRPADGVTMVRVVANELPRFSGYAGISWPFVSRSVGVFLRALYPD